MARATSSRQSRHSAAAAVSLVRKVDRGCGTSQCVGRRYQAWFGDRVGKGKMMGKKLYVGNLPFSFTSTELEQLFAPHGRVTSAQVVVDRATNRSRGFGFVEFDSDEASSKATAELNGKN